MGAAPPPGAGVRFAELLSHPGVEEVVELRSTFGFLAFHGGSLEEGTDGVAAAAAERSGASLYVVRQPPDLRWHVPSREVTRDGSDALHRFLDHVDVALAIHGYGREGRWQTLMAGGSHRALAEHVRSHVEAALPGYEVVTDLDGIPVELRGLHPSNPVNVVRGGGVQLELPPRVRGIGPYWSGDRAVPAGELAPHTEALVDALAQSVRSWTVAASPNPSRAPCTTTS